MTNVIPPVVLTSPSGSGVSLKRRFLLYSSNPMSDIITAVGRYRIKKKDAVVPFRQTLVYRLILIFGSAVLFIISIFQLTTAIAQSNTVAMVVTGSLGVIGAIGAFYNLDRARYARLSEHSAKRLRRK